MTTTGTLLAQLYEQVIGHAPASPILSEADATVALHAVLDHLHSTPSLDDFGDFINRIYSRVVHSSVPMTLDRGGPMQWLARIQEIEAKLDAYNIKFRADYGQLQQQLEATQEELAREKAIRASGEISLAEMHDHMQLLNQELMDARAKVNYLQQPETRGLSLHEDRLISAVADLSKAMAAIVPRLKDPLDALE
jgi:hypothetical protein